MQISISWFRSCRASLSCTDRIFKPCNQSRFRKDLLHIFLDHHNCCIVAQNLPFTEWKSCLLVLIPACKHSRCCARASETSRSPTDYLKKVLLQRWRVQSLFLQISFQIVCISDGWRRSFRRRAAALQRVCEPSCVTGVFSGSGFEWRLTIFGGLNVLCLHHLATTYLSIFLILYFYFKEHQLFSFVYFTILLLLKNIFIQKFIFFVSIVLFCPFSSVVKIHQYTV